MADDVTGLAQWIIGNQDKAGTPEYVSKADQYRQLRSAQKASSAPAAAPAAPAAPAGPEQAYTDIGVPIGSSPNPTPTDPYSAGNTARRVVTGAATGLPDIAIALGNAGVRAGGGGGGFGMYGVEPGSVKEAPYLGPMVNKMLGGQELPKDASTTRQLLEGGASALIGGGANAVRSAIQAAPTVARSVIPAITTLSKTVAAPTVASHYGGQVGGWVGEKAGDRETGALLGSLLGGVGGGSASDVPRAYTDWRYRGQGKPNAPEIAAQAARQGVPTTAGMLGNENIQMQERALANRPGAMAYINDRRTSAREAIASALDRIAAARGSTNPTPTSGTIGYDVTQVAGQGRDQLAAQSSRGQEQLQTRIGPRTDTDVSGILAAMESIRNRTDPGTAAPIDARTDTLRQMLPRDPEGNVTSTNVPYERVKDWRTNLRERSQNYDPVPGRYSGEIYDATTGAMRDAGTSQGVPPGFFDRVQGRTRAAMGPGGPHEQLDKVANSEPSTAFNFLRGGEQNPQRLRMLEATGNPMLDSVFGDYLRRLGNNTIGTAGARGPANLATSIERMHPEALDVIGGRQAPDIRDVAGLARSFDYPTSQTGLGRTVGPIAGGAARTITGSEIGSALGHASGIPYASEVGRIAGAYLQSPISNMRARIQQSGAARNALAGGARPQIAPTISDLVTALNAAQASQQQQRGPSNGIPR